MKKLITSALLSVFVCSSLFAQLSIQNGSFETPSDGLKYRADGSGTSLFNNNVPGWWADANATDCGRQATSKGGADGTLSGYAFNNDNGGTIWATAGTVEASKLSLAISFSSKLSYTYAAGGSTPTNLLLKLATYEGSNPASFQLITTLSKAVTTQASWTKYDYTYTLPTTTAGKNLLIGFDIETVATDGTWFLFDNFTLSATGTTAVDSKTSDRAISVYCDQKNAVLCVNNIEKNTEFTLTDITGKVAKTGILNSIHTIELNGISKGIYILNLKTESGVKSFKTIFN